MARILIGMIVAPALIGAFAVPADAAPRRGEDFGSVRACSKYGKGCLTAAVRPGRFDHEVRMPGGTWISCKRDCRETLREEAIDFWETLRERAPDWNR